MKTNSRSLALFAFASLAATVSGCGSSDSGSRPTELINAERMAVPTLYLKESGDEVVAPNSLEGVVVDDGELAWKAWRCTNPACPGQPKGDRPFLFVWKDPRANVQPDGSVGYQSANPTEDAMDARMRLGGTRDPTCPACLPGRTVAKESPAETAKFVDWCVPYVLPETEQRLKELTEEHKLRQQQVAERVKK